MGKNNFVPINYISRNSIIDYDEENSNDLILQEEFDDDNDILTNNYIYDYLD